jgi:Arc/MetJ-type ribon-helix-helix transcriptional regulator
MTKEEAKSKLEIFEVFRSQPWGSFNIDQLIDQLTQKQKFKNKSDVLRDVAYLTKKKSLITTTTDNAIIFKFDRDLDEESTQELRAIAGVKLEKYEL